MKKAKFVPFTVSIDDLIALGACDDQVELFRDVFKRRKVRVTAEVIKKHGKEFDLYWFCRHMLREYNPELAMALEDEMSDNFDRYEAMRDVATYHLTHRKDGVERTRLDWGAICDAERPLNKRQWADEDRIIIRYLGMGAFKQEAGHVRGSD